MKKYLPLAFLSILFVLLLVYLNNLYYQNLIKIAEKNIPEVKFDTEIPWQTYRNEKYGFEFQHPSQIKFYEEINKNYLLSLKEENISDDELYSFMSVSIYIDTKNNYKDFKANDNLIIDDINSLQYDFLNGDQTPPHRVVVVKKDNYYFHIRFDWNSDNQQEKIFNLILSTFKFSVSTSIQTQIPNSDKLIERDYINKTPMYFYYNNQRYFIESNADYAGKIIYSPDNKYACIEWGSSGYWGYHLYKIATQNVVAILNGPQYSYCDSFSKTNLTVKEKPYDTKKSEIYSIDLQTLKRNLVSSVVTNTINVGQEN